MRRLVHEGFTESITELPTRPMMESPRFRHAEPLAEILRRQRRSSGLTQEDLAERAAISARTVSDIERGLRSTVYRETAVRLADALGLEGVERQTFLDAARHGPSAPSTSPGPGHAGVGTFLPSPLTRLIGREGERADVVAALRSGVVRLLTLLGPGGVGKTRLAVEVASEARGHFSEGACFVPLAVTDDATLVPSLIARELGIASVRKPMHEALLDYLRDREILLVLDSFEHLLSAAPFVAELAVMCPRVSFLVTSRAPLGIRGEHEISLAPLPVPPTHVDVSDLARYAAAGLFLERARAVKPDLTLDPDSVATVARICRRLDGLPLALEIAAVRLRHMPLGALEIELDRRLDLLVGGPRDLPARQQTMRDAIAWSYDLLPPVAQRLFRAVSTFSGGWTLSSARALWGTDRGLLGEMTNLADGNLVAVDERSDVDPRFGMLDVIREFANEQVEVHAEAAVLARGHAMLFADLAEAAEVELGGGSQETWYRRLELEQDNMRAALAWAIAAREARVAQRLAGALWLFWRRHGDYVEARRWLDQALDVADSVDDVRGGSPADTAQRPDRALKRKVLWGNAWISYYQGDYAHVARLGRELLRLAEQDGDPVGIRNGLTIRALEAMAEGRFGDAVPRLEEGVRICRMSCSPWLLATSLLVLGTATLNGQDLVRSRLVLEEALSLYESLGDRLFSARARVYLGYVALLAGRTSAANHLMEDSLRSFSGLAERFGIAEGLQAVAVLRAAEGQDERAAELAGAAQALWTSMSAQPLASDRPVAASFLDPARRRLGPSAWRAAWRRGQMMDVHLATSLALRRKSPLTRTSARG